MSNPDEESNVAEPDPLASFPSEPESDLTAPRPVVESAAPNPANVKDLPARSEKPDVVVELRTQLEHAEHALVSTKNEVAELKKELATIVGSLKDIDRRVRRQTDSGVLRSLPPILSTKPVRYRNAALAGLMIGVAIGVGVWQFALGPRATDQPARSTPGVESQAAPSAPSAAPSAAGIVPVSTPPAPVAEPIPVPVTRVEYRGTLRIVTEPSGVSVLIDRRNVGKTPLRMSFKAGSHLVWLERDGYRRWTGVVPVTADQLTTVRATLQAELPDRSQP